MRLKFVLTVFITLLSQVLAQGVQFSPQSIIVNPLPSFAVEVFVDRDSSGNAQPTYQIGDSIRIGLRTTEDSYVYLYNVRSNGDIVQIFPNGFDGNNYVVAHQTRYFPDANSGYSFAVDGPTGTDKVIAVASKTPLNNMPLSHLRAQFNVQNLGEASFAQALSIVIEPLPSANWVSDTALFYVAGQSSPPPPPTAQYGSLNLRSQPSGADIYIDGQYIGQTPLYYDLAPGQHDVRYVLGGYESFHTFVNVLRGETRSLEHRFISNQPQQLGVSFSSDPSGAEVYVDNRFVGVTPTATIYLNRGQHQVEFIRSGYLPTQLSITVSANNQSYHVNLNQSVNNGNPLFAFGLTPYPGSYISFVTTNDDEIRLEFQSSADLIAIFNHFDQSLTAQSYRRADLDINSNAGRVQAEYLRSDHAMEFSLRQLGQGRYRLDLDLD